MEIVPTMCIFNNDNVQIDINSSSHWHWCYTFLHFVENITDPIDYQHGMHFLRIIKYSLKTCIVHMTQNSKIMKIRMHLFSVESRFTSYVHCFHVKLFFFLDKIPWGDQTLHMSSNISSEMQIAANLNLSRWRWIIANI